MSTSAEPLAGRGLGNDQPPCHRGGMRTLRDSAAAVFGAVMGLVPHLMHHIGLIAGTAVVAGAAGNAVLFAIGLLFSMPFLQRLYRRFRTWWAPVIAVGAFAVLFSLSAFVIGPTIGDGGAADNAPVAPSQPPAGDHAAHHSGQ